MVVYAGRLLSRKGLLNVANGALVSCPECLHDFEFELRQFWLWHLISYRCSKKYHRCLFWVNGIVTKRNFPAQCLRPLVRGGFLHLIDRDYVDGRLLSRELQPKFLLQRVIEAGSGSGGRVG